MVVFRIAGKSVEEKGLFSFKVVLKFFLVALLTVASYFFVSAGVVGFQTFALKKEVKLLINEIHRGATVNYENQETAKIEKSIIELNATLTNPFWRPITNHFLKDAQREIVLGLQLVKVAPSVMGSQSPKKYLLVFQNSAESRGTGGIIGAYAEIQVYRGAFTVLRQGSNVGLKSLSVIPISMPTEYNTLWGSDPAIWQNSNESPHFPYAAQIYSALWKNQFHENLDGVIATDPEALSSVLKAIGPVSLSSGEVIDSTNVVSKTLSTAYQRFAKDNLARKQYLVDVMKAVMQKLMSGNYSKLNLARQLQTPLLENRILMSLSDTNDQSVIAPTLISGFVSQAPNNEFRVVIINTSGNKLDYYLTKETKIQSVSCKVPTTRVTETITNTLATPKGLPDYVVGRLDLKLPHGANGRDGFSVLIYGPTGAQVENALRTDSNQATPDLPTERGHPIALFHVDLAPKTSETYTVIFSGGTGPISYVKQPLVNPEKLVLQDSCH